MVNMRCLAIVNTRPLVPSRAGEEAMLGPTAAELDNAREQLDQAQEELVGLMERCERLEQELEVARRKNRVYQVSCI